MHRKLWHSFISRWCASAIAFGFGLLVGGSNMLITYIIGGILIVVGIILFAYNYFRPDDVYIPTIEESAKGSKIIWGFWHTGERAKDSFRYGSFQRVLLLEPNRNSESFSHLTKQAQVQSKELYENIRLTTDKAIANHVAVRWYDDPTVISFMICDPSPQIGNDEVVNFSKRAYVVVQVVDAHISRSEWAKYKKSMNKDEHAFNEYVKWFKDVWYNRSKDAVLREQKND